MHPGNFVSIDYATLIPQNYCQQCICDSDTLHTLEESWGVLRTHTYAIPCITVTQVTAEIKRNLHVRHHEEDECTTIDSWFSISGNINSKFSGLENNVMLTKGLQNFIYKPVLQDDHFIQQQNEPVSIFHTSLDRVYFMDLLGGDDRWCVNLRDRIARKQLIGGANQLKITPVMHRVIHEIINCPLTGALKRLLIEAKTLELVAYQLHQVTCKGLNDSSQTSKNDRDTFYAIREHLQRTFDQEHSLRSLSREFGLNEFKLKQGFKHLFGYTVFSYIHALKMQQAKILIEKNGLNVAQVANRSGYKNANHFSAAFKKQFGLSPSSIRR